MTSELGHLAADACSSAQGSEVQKLDPGALPWHLHDSAYVAVVLDGGYEEAGDGGFHRVRPGDVLLHDPFERHANTVLPGGAQVVNFDVPARIALGLRSGACADPLAFARALRDGDWSAAAFDALTAPRQAGDEEDALARALIDDGVQGLTDYAEHFGLAPRTLRRRFAARYGMSPARFRARARARRAWREVVGTGAPLADIAYALGFADQPHMSRAVAALTGVPPSAWRGGLAV